MARRRTPPIVMATLVLLWVVLAHAQTSLPAADAKSHVGEKATVCGSVVSIHYASQGRGQPTFVNLDKPYPNQIFTILIWGNDRAKFGDPEASYRGKQVCATGKIELYRGVPEVVAHEASQIRIR